MFPHFSIPMSVGLEGIVFYGSKAARLLVYLLAAISAHTTIIPLFEDQHYFHFERNILYCFNGQGITLHGLFVGSGLLVYKGYQLLNERWKEEADTCVVLRGY